MNPRRLHFATFLAPSVLPVYQRIATFVGEQLGCQTELSVGHSFASFAHGDVDVGFICGLPYVRLMRHAPSSVELLAAPVLQGKRYGGLPIYFSDIVVRRESPFHTFADLRGHSWAYNDRESHSGYTLTLHELARRGETRGYFSQVIEAGYHQTALRLVADGQVDASAIDSQVLAIELRDNQELADRVRIIGTFGPSTIQPVVAASRLPAELKADLRAALFAIGDDAESRPILDGGLVDRLMPIADSAYDDIRAMVATAHAAGLTVLR